MKELFCALWSVIVIFGIVLSMPINGASLLAILAAVVIFNGWWIVPVLLPSVKEEER